LSFDDILGLKIAEWSPAIVDVPEAVLAMADARQKAREDKDWARADELRDEALAAGYVIEDTRDGPKVKKA
jgi:cysteinyl-tRNA synthetase